MTTRENLPPYDDGTAKRTVSRRVALGTAAGLAVLSGTPSHGRAGCAATTGQAPRRDDHLAIPPEDHGAVGDGVTDDTAALQATFDTGRSVRLAPGKTYLVTSRLRLSTSGISLSGGGRIKVARDFNVASDSDGNGTHMRVLFVTSPDVSISNIIFDAIDAPSGSAVENGLIWTTAPSTTIRDCRFLGNPKGTSIWGLGNAPYLSVIGCQFLGCSGAVFAKGRSTVINDNIVVDATDAAIAINGASCVGAVIANNTISNEKLTMLPSMIAVEDGASSWTITGNTLLGVNGGGIVCTNVLDLSPVRGGIIANNVIDARRFDQKLPVGPNPAGLLSVSDSYTSWIMHDNRVTGCPSGNPNSRLVLISASGGTFHDNIVDGTAIRGLSAMIAILPGSGGLTIRDNKTISAEGGRHFLFAAGDYGDVPCLIEGGRFHGGAEGINAELEAKGIKRLRLHIHDIADSNVSNIVNAPTILGDRSLFLNAGAWARPHRIGIYTEMYCTTVPTASGTMPFQPGDRLHFMAPHPGQPVGIVRTAKGWNGFGMIV